MILGTSLFIEIKSIGQFSLKNKILYHFFINLKFNSKKNRALV